MRAGHLTRWLMAACLAAAVFLPAPSLAQRPVRIAWQQRRQPPQRPGPGGPGHTGYWLRRYKDVPPHEQERALQNDPQFRRLPPGRQQQLRQQLRQWSRHISSLPPEQQERELRRMEVWEHLTPEQKHQARQFHNQMQQLPPDRRRMVNRAIDDLRAMPPQQRDQVIDSERFKNAFSPQEREMLRVASGLPLAPPENGGPAEAAPQE